MREVKGREVGQLSDVLGDIGDVVVREKESLQ